MGGREEPEFGMIQIIFGGESGWLSDERLGETCKKSVCTVSNDHIIKSDK